MPKATPTTSNAAPTEPVRESAVLAAYGAPPWANPGPWANRGPPLSPTWAPLEETGLEETGLEETGLEETGLEETGLEETGLEETGLEGTGGVRRPTGMIVPGASISVNFPHAADQPSEVSGHHCNGCDRDPPTVQIP
jgi:hypothetical protein